eukprot:5383246-Prorocentrum_lima.AAC.1
MITAPAAGRLAGLQRQRVIPQLKLPPGRCPQSSWKAPPGLTQLCWEGPPLRCRPSRQAGEEGGRAGQD